MQHQGLTFVAGFKEIPALPEVIPLWKYCKSHADMSENYTKSNALWMCVQNLLTLIPTLSVKPNFKSNVFFFIILKFKELSKGERSYPMILLPCSQSTSITFDCYHALLGEEKAVRSSNVHRRVQRVRLSQLGQLALKHILLLH
mmetsp:Transcript_21681/g.43835  ORF Transcript_21681/g.43835 Transcript_21681/m.43835 type:complete len:144 (+) Transcript_21681:157-588(+)